MRSKLKKKLLRQVQRLLISAPPTHGSPMVLTTVIALPRNAWVVAAMYLFVNAPNSETSEPDHTEGYA